VLNERRQATVTALTDTVCYIVDQAAMRCVFETRPSVAEDISALLADRQTALEASREGLGSEARARRTRETRSRLLIAIRSAFGI
jgi:CRP-like cAMP-binding protein